MNFLGPGISWIGSECWGQAGLVCGKIPLKEIKLNAFKAHPLFSLNSVTGNFLFEDIISLVPQKKKKSILNDLFQANKGKRLKILLKRRFL